MIKSGICVVVALLMGQATTPERLPVRQKSGRQDRKGPLAGLPSAPGAHLERIRGLKDGEWINLGAPAPDPKWGSARGRSWSAYMTYAPDLHGAFIIGMGRHNYTTPEGRLQDDIFFYDVNAHRWINVLPGTDTTTFLKRAKAGELKLNDDGQLVDKEGQPVPVGMIPHHAYHSHSYDTDQKKFAVAWVGWGFGNASMEPGSKPQWESDFKEAQAAVAAKSGGKPDRVVGTPHFFNTMSGKFERFPLQGQPLAGHNQGGVHGVLCYLPTRKGFFHFYGTTQFYDAATHQCHDAGAKGAPPPGSTDVGCCYDSKRDRVIMGRGMYAPPPRPDEGNIYIYDVKSNAWSNPPNKPNAAGFPGCNSGAAHYDSVNDRVIVWSHIPGTREGGSLNVYNPETGAWEGGGVAIPPQVGGAGECWHGFYSPEANAHFLYVAGDSEDKGTMWAFRYKNHKK